MWELIFDLYKNVSYYFLLINLILIILFFILSFKYIKTKFKKIKKKTWLVLGFIFIIGLTLRLSIPHVHEMYLDEVMYLETAKNFLQEQKPVLCYYTDYEQKECDFFLKSIGWPFLISLMFSIFGINNFYAMYFSSIIGSLTPILVFLLTYILFEKKKISLIAASLIAIYPTHIRWSGTAETNIVALFFTLLCFLFFLIYFINKNLKTHFLAILTLIFTLHIRIELILLLPIIISCYFLFYKNLKDLKRLKFYYPWFIFLPSLLIFIPQLFLQIVIQEKNYPKFYFNFSFFINNLITLLKGATISYNVILIIFLLYGIFICYKNYKKKFYFLLMWFFIFFIFYLFFLKMQSRMLILPYTALILFISIGLCNFIINKKKKNRLLLIILLFLVLVILAIPTVTNLFKRNITLNIIETKAPELIEKKNKDCYIITEHPIVVSSTTNIKSISTAIILTNPKIVDNILEKDNCILWFEDAFCYLYIKEDISNWERCEEMKQSYKLSAYLKIRHKKKSLTLYNVSKY